MKPRGIGRGRVPIALTALTVTGAVVVALTGAATPRGGADFLQNGHWVHNAVLGGIYHLNGATGAIDAQVAAPDVPAGSQVVQGGSSGYVILPRGQVVEFSKSTLRVEKTTQLPTTAEAPVPLQVTGGPYLVFKQAGKISRLGGRTAGEVSTDGAVGDPVATADGTVWVHRTDTGAICKLAKEATRLACPAEAPKGHAGSLTVVADQPVFLNTTADTVHAVGEGPLDEGTKVGADLPPTARPASTDVDGRIAVLDPGGKRLLLVDAGGLDRSRPAEQPRVVSLPSGEYADVESSGQRVVVVDKTRNSVLTYNRDGGQVGSAPVPPGATRVSRGEDSRVYVDNVDGTHVVAVDHDGKIIPVPITKDRISTSGKPPQPPPAEPSLSTVQGPPSSRYQPPRLDPPRRGTTVAARPNTVRPVTPASPPGAPPGVRATAGNGQLTVNWGAAAANGAAVSAYHVSWTSSAGGDSVRVGGGARSNVIRGLANGTAYTVTVVAENPAGRGPGAQSRATPVVPKPVRSIELSRGRPELYKNDCTYLPHSALMRVTLRGFTPGSRVLVIPYSDNKDYRNEGTTQTVGGDGSVTFQAFHFCQVGRNVWVRGDGVQSNTIRWVSQ
ncbi:fibronectin type III domain-containing protein [Crossiella sp. CA198]|uniref:fibronectin type III domain-containing protein n=1 Tax=Crossiella sp. CA198 TaxID=3455607 RepID=UPI003F8D0D9E